MGVWAGTNYAMYYVATAGHSLLVVLPESGFAMSHLAPRIGWLPNWLTSKPVTLTCIACGREGFRVWWPRLQVFVWVCHKYDSLTETGGLSWILLIKFDMFVFKKKFITSLVHPNVHMFKMSVWPAKVEVFCSAYFWQQFSCFSFDPSNMGAFGMRMMSGMHNIQGDDLKFIYRSPS